ncbi:MULTISPECIES: oxygenase MpaB family protein [Mycobacteriaceae]|uniref:ER-bound oxygenase mpaB/mpaB'/Rubber oxygenase catalytic domain-containing protein n=1 Tax=Mycobacteroides salmoniphilum TaxID=404941 RepID=A0A4R8SDI1_9MYCO|nr:oxygenase MpaB family protein [Mycobacteroides salmoniphilum]MBA0048550.1 DUF2236 domain-containing protein [Mycobacteroides sp. LB1]TDZ93517.1 hypothetical protein CCUG60885_03120 [Mycobacteroides salmoniphilum]TEA09300.1 hypothetical protein CCUG60883_00061 [Mycobacteroides salmoniphilum]
MSPKTNALHRMGDTDSGDDPKWDWLLRLHGDDGGRALKMARAERIDDGYFGPDSISWKIYNNLVVSGMGAMSGLFIATLDPVGGYGVGQHSVYYTDTLGRVRRSLQFFSGAVFGDTAMADRLGRDLFRRHSRVNGELPSTGESYRANHVEALKFTYVMGWPHLWRAYKAFGDPDATEQDERDFYAEQHIVAELLGIPSGELPLTPEEVRKWVQDAEEQIVAFTRPAQEMIDFLLHPPLFPLWPMLPISVGARVLTWAAIPLMSPYVREISDLSRMTIRPKIGTLLIRLAARLVKTPVVDRVFSFFFGFDTWGYYHNAARRTLGTGRAPFTHNPGLALQQGKGGTLSAREEQGTPAKAGL